MFFSPLPGAKRIVFLPWLTKLSFCSQGSEISEILSVKSGRSIFAKLLFEHQSGYWGTIWCLLRRKRRKLWPGFRCDTHRKLVNHGGCSVAAAMSGVLTKLDISPLKEERRTALKGFSILHTDLGKNKTLWQHKFDCDRQKVPPITFQDSPPLSKSFLWALCQRDVWIKSCGFRKCSFWRLWLLYT